MRSALAWLVNRIGDLYRSEYKYEEAKSYYERGIKLREKAQGADHADVASDLMDLAWLNLNKPDFAAAEQAARKSLAIRERLAKGSDDASAAWPVEFLGLLASARKDYTAAIDFHKRALSIREKALGNGHPDVTRSLKNIARVYESRKQFDEAEAVYKDSIAQGASPRLRSSGSREGPPGFGALLHCARTQRPGRAVPQALARNQ